MAAYVIYNSEGTVTGALRFHHIDESAALLAANTPAGMATLLVPDDSPVLMDQRGWAVVDGKLTLVPPSEADLLAAAKGCEGERAHQ
jgi:hypothetical protein